MPAMSSGVPMRPRGTDAPGRGLQVAPLLASGIAQVYAVRGALDALAAAIGFCEIIGTYNHIQPRGGGVLYAVRSGEDPLGSNESAAAELACLWVLATFHQGRHPWIRCAHSRAAADDPGLIHGRATATLCGCGQCRQ